MARFQGSVAQTHSEDQFPQAASTRSLADTADTNHGTAGLSERVADVAEPEVSAAMAWSPFPGASPNLEVAEVTVAGVPRHPTTEEVHASIGGLVVNRAGTGAMCRGRTPQLKVPWTLRMRRFIEPCA